MKFSTPQINHSIRIIYCQNRLNQVYGLALLLILAIASGNKANAQCAFTATANLKGNGCHIAEEQVRWASPGDVTVLGNSLTKSGGGNGWNAGAESTALVADGGYMYTVANETNINRMIGLSTNNQNNNFNSIDYAFYLRSSGVLGIFESGNNRGNFAVYVSGDTLRIANEGGKIKYYHNQNLLRTENIATGTSLLVDCSINTVGGTLRHVHIGNITQNTFTASISNAGAAPSYAWSVNATPAGNNSPNFIATALAPGDVITCALTPGVGSCATGIQNSNTIRIRPRKTPSVNDFRITATALQSGCKRSIELVSWSVAALANVESNGSNLSKIQSNGNWDGGAYSLNSVVNNGYLEFTNSEITRKAIGLSHTNPDNNFNTISYAFFFETGGSLRIYENGTNRGVFGSYAINDVFRIFADQGVVKYYRNGTLLRISTVAPTLPLFADVSLRDVGATVTNAVISNFNGGTFTANVQNAGTNPILQWKLNGTNVGTNSSSYSNSSLNDGDIVRCDLTPDFDGCTGSAFASSEILITNAISLNAINFYISANPAVAACATTLEDVVWNRATLTNNEATGNNLIKIQSTGNWNGNGASLNRVANNGYFEFTNSEITRKIVGLSDVDLSSNFTSIKYGFFFESGTVLRIYENGTDRGTFGNYAIGDVFRITVQTGVVKYYKNGTLLRISTVAPTLPLLVDVSLRNVGATVTNAVISNFNSGTFTAFAANAGANPTYQWKINGTIAGANSNVYSNGSLSNGDIVTCELTPNINNCSLTAIASSAIEVLEAPSPPSLNFFIAGEVASSACAIAIEDAVWNSASFSNVNASTNNLLKVQSNGNWDGGAASLNTVADNGYFEFTNSEITRKTVGLSDVQLNSNFTSIKYGFFFESGTVLRIYENGTDRGTFGNYAINDVFRITVETGLVKYYKNGTLLRVSTVLPALPLLVDVSLRDVGATVTDAKIANFNVGTLTANVQNAGSNPVFQWKLNGANVGANTPTYTNSGLIDGDAITCELTPDIDGCEFTIYTSNEIALETLDNSPSIDFYISGETVSAGCFLATKTVAWESASLLNVTATGNNLLKVQSNGNWNGGAFSQNAVADNGYLEFTNAETLRKAVGLSTNNSNAAQNTLNYAFIFESGGVLRIMENGTDRGAFGTHAIGNIFRIAVENGVVKYYRNGTLLRISTVVPSLPLKVDVSLRDVGSTVSSALIANFNGGIFTANVSSAGVNPTFQWKLNGTNVGSNSVSYTNTSLQDNDIITCELIPDLGGCGAVVYTSNNVSITQVENPVSISFYITANAVPFACNAAVENVVWNPASLSNTEANGNNLLKVQGGSSWNANASSLNEVYNNGYLEFTASETNRNRMVGLSQTDASASFNTIRYAFYLINNGGIQIYENGANRGTFGTFQTGDLLRITADDGIIKYYRNGTLLRTTTLLPTFPLRADVSINQVGGTVNNAVISNYNNGTFTAIVDNAGPAPTYQWMVNGSNVGTNSNVYSNTTLSSGDIITCVLSPDLGGCGELSYTSKPITKLSTNLPVEITFYIQSTNEPSGYGIAIENIAWNTASLQNVQATENNLLKVLSNNNWNGNAASHNTVKDNGYFEFTAFQTNHRRMVGLSNTDANANFNTIRYAFDLNSNGQLRIYENGTNRGLFGNYAIGDIFRISVELGIVNYYRNGALIYTSALAPTLPLLADVSISNVGGRVTNAVVANTTGGVFTAHVQNAGSSPNYQWKLNGTNVGANTTTYTNLGLLDGDIITCELTPDLTACGTSDFTSNIITISGPDGTTDWIGAISTNWHNPANWSSGVPNQFIDATIPAGTPFSPAVNAPAPLKNLEIETGANLTTASSTMQVYGDINNLGTIIGSLGTVAFLGGVSATISGNITRFNRVIFNKASALERVILNTSIEIIDETVFIMGIVETGANEVIYINDANSREGLPESHVEGVCRKIGNQTFRFPVGRNGIYAPISISAPALTTAEFTATYIYLDPEEDGYTTADRDPSLVTLSRCEYWLLNREVGTSSVAVTLSFENVRSCGVTNPADLRVSRWTGTNWQNHGYLTHTGDANSGTVTSGLPILNFSPFTLGSGTSVNPLPIDLLSFEAKRSGIKVDVKWTTAAEVNNDFFTLERSSDGANYAAIAIIQGAGNSPSAINYVHSDMSPLKGTSYYRLRQTDFDGTSKVYPPQSVFFGGGLGTSVYPNPTDGYFRVLLPANDEPATLRLIAASGARIWTKITEGSIAENNVQGLAPGVYILEVEAKNYVERFKLIIR